jgi:diguanylate cyclase (GGDEF)-like protein/PAS domain S-box-containing protein
MKWSTSRKTAAGFSLALVFVLFRSVISYSTVLGLINTVDAVQQSHDILNELDNTQSTMVDAEIGTRGFFITGDETYVEPYKSAVAHVVGHVERLKGMTADDPNQQSRVLVLAQAITNKLDTLSETITERRKVGFDLAHSLPITAQGEAAMDTIRNVIGEMQAQENDILRARQAASNDSARNTILTIVSMVLIVAALLLLVYHLIKRDTAKQARAMQAVRESEHKYRRLMEQASDGILVVDKHANFIEVNSRMCAMLGYTREEMLQLTARDIVKPGDLAMTPLNIEELRAGKIVEGARLLVRKDGSVFPSENSVNMLEDGSVQSIVRDVTDRNQAEEALRISEERLGSVITALEEGIVLQNADGTISAINNSAERVLGITAGQMLSLKSFHTKLLSIHEDGSPFLDKDHPAKLTLRTGQPCSKVIMGIYKLDGKLDWVSINSQPLIKHGERKPYAVVSSFTDITDRKRAEQVLLELAIRDELTGLYNRREMSRLLKDEINRYNRYGHPVSLVMLDLDQFKQVNDKYGHQTGDEVLKWIANLLRKNLRETDQLTRYGGEEFAFILPETSQAEAIMLADRIRQAVAAEIFTYTSEDRQTTHIPITASLGVAGVSVDITTEDNLVAAADAALYEAKRQGRNRTIHASSLQAKVQDPRLVLS